MRYERNPGKETLLYPVERRALACMRRLPPHQMERLVEKIAGWVEAMVEEDKGRRR